MTTEAKILAEYRAAIKAANEKHVAALARASRVYERKRMALLKEAAAATVGKPKRSKAGGTRSRS